MDHPSLPPPAYVDPPALPYFHRVPTELLGEIFHCVNHDAQVSHRINYFLCAAPPAQEEYRVFPYNVAGVCTVWQRVSSQFPSFWRRLIISVNSELPTPLGLVEYHLWLSRNLPLSVTVQRTDKTDEDVNERSKVLALMQVLHPHLHRVSELNIQLLLGSSLPAISKDLHGVSPLLDKLVLSCRRDDGSPQLEANSPGSCHTFPIDIGLTCIVLSGYTIIDALKHAAHALRNPKTTILGIQCLNAANYEDDVMDFILTELFDTLSVPRDEGSENEGEAEGFHWLRAYILNNLAFANYVLPYDQPETVLSEGVTLFLTELSRCALKAMTQAIDLTGAHVIVEDCRVDSVTFLGYPNTLWGTNLSGDLHHIIQGWGGSEIALQNCPGFNDDTLSLLRPQSNPTYNELGVLKLADCPNFSTCGLRNLVEDRCNALECTDNPNRSFWELVVVDPRPLPEETAQWFSRHVHFFRWCIDIEEPWHVL